MALHLILGDAGGGQREFLLDDLIRQSLARPDKSFLLLVPEQSCLSTQHLLVQKHPRHALLNIEALSFDRLAGRAFREFCIAPQSVISETVKQMILALALRDVREELVLYRRAALFSAFTGRLASLFAEWDMNDTDPSLLLERAEALLPDSLLCRKLQDLSLIFRAFRRRMGEKMTAEQRLPLFNRLLPGSDMARVEGLYLEGFTGFTAVQYRILEQLMGRAVQTTVALSLPQGEDPDTWFKAEARNRDDLFAMSLETIWRLKRLAEQLGQKHESIRYADSPADREKDLAFLTEHVLRPRRKSWSGSAPHIQLWSLEDPEAEAEWAARRVAHLTREQGLKYSDIALITGDKDLYLPLLERYLTEEEISYFTDKRESLGDHPLAAFLVDAWECVSKGWERDAFLRFIKNPFSPLDAEEGDRLENYLLAAGIRKGSALKGPYERRTRRRRGETAEEYEARTGAELAEMNALGERCLPLLLSLEESLGRGKFPAGPSIRALGRFLETLPAADPLPEAREAMADMLASMEGFFGDTMLDRHELGDMLKASLAALSVGKLPKRPDQLMIGDVERSRFGHVKHLIFLGMNEGLVPRQSRGQDLLSDEERKLLATEEEAAYTDERSLMEERFYLYQLLSLPRQALDLSFARMDLGRKGQQPSSLIREIRDLFPVLSLQIPDLSDLDTIYSPLGAFRSLARNFRNNQTDWAILFRALSRRDRQSFDRSFGLIEAGASYQIASRGLSRAEARTLFGPVLFGGVTRFESFAVCPFKHYLEYGLALEEREELSWENSRHGSLFHRVMEVMMRQLAAEGLSPSDLDEKGRRERVSQALAQAEAEAPALGEQMNALYLRSRWQRFFENYLEAAASFEAGTAFKAEAFELRFGGGGEQAFDIPLSEEGRLSLVGIIDRLDICEKDGIRYLRVVDYKTGSQEIDPGQISLGTQLQLGVYLEAALRLQRRGLPPERVRAGGMVYSLLKEQWLSEWKKAEKREENRQDSFRCRGLIAAELAGEVSDTAGGSQGKKTVSAAGLELIGEGVRGRLKAIGDQILAGCIEARPVQFDNNYTSCERCPYHALCDRKSERFSYRLLPKTSLEELIAEFREEKDGI